MDLLAVSKACHQGNDPYALQLPGDRDPMQQQFLWGSHASVGRRTVWHPMQKFTKEKLQKHDLTRTQFCQRCMLQICTIVISFIAELHLICIVMAELERKIWEGGLKATRCVNSPGPRRLVSIHLGILCHLQAVCMQATEPRLWKTGWASPRPFLQKKKKEKERCPWLRRCCLAWGQQLHHSRPANLACGNLWNFYKIQTFLLLFHFKRLIWTIKILKLGRCCFHASNWIFGAFWPWHTVYRGEYYGLLKSQFSPTPQSVGENPDRATSAVNHKLIIWQETKG